MNRRQRRAMGRRNPDRLLDMFMSYAMRKMRHGGVGELPPDATVLVPGRLAQTADGQQLFGQEAARGALRACIDDGVLRLEMVDGELVAIWAGDPSTGEPETRVYPGREMPDLH